MNRVTISLLLFISFIAYSLLVYTRGTEEAIGSADPTPMAGKGKQIFQDYNCSSCHQIYGLGGYLGPDLTTAYSDTNRGEPYMRALLSSGGARMPNFHFSKHQIDAIIAYFRYVDATAGTKKANL